MNEDILQEFVGKEVKVPFRDAETTRIARGVLVSYDENFIKIKGELGTLIIQRKSIYKIGLLKNG